MFTFYLLVFKVDVRKVFVKALGYRLLMIVYELLLACIILHVFGIVNVFVFIFVNNCVKLILYVMYDLLWLKRRRLERLR